MTYPSVDDEQPASLNDVVEERSRSGFARGLALLGGAGTLAVCGTITVGLIGIPLVVLLITAVVKHRRGRRYTKFQRWMTTVGATAIMTLIGIGFVTRELPSNFLDQAYQQQQERERTHPTDAPEWLKRMNPNQGLQNNPLVQEQTHAIVQSKGFMTGILVLSVPLASLFVGAILGTMAWGSALLLGFAFTGRWPPSTPSHLSKSLLTTSPDLL